MKKWGDTYKEPELKGDKVNIEEVIGKPVALLGGYTRKSKWHNSDFVALQLQDLETEKEFFIMTGSAVIVEQFNKISESNDFPIEITIEKKESKDGVDYYSFA